AGALYAQYNAFVTLNLFGFERSGTALVMLVLGGVGRLYGAIVGVPLYMLLEDRFAKISPEFWGFGIGLLLVLGVLFLRGGLAGSLAAIFGRARGPRGGGATDDVRFGGGQGG
ncbi:MAG: branched-chain amino acid ABC transporter permease, partial [Burkholderiales bacterium]